MKTNQMKTNKIRAAILALSIALGACLAPVCFAQGSAQGGNLALLALNFQSRPPDWAVGSYEGTNRFLMFDVELTISGFGNITGSTRGDDGRRESFSGRFNDGYVRIRGKRYKFEQIFRGIRLTEEGNSRNTANLSKTRGTGAYNPEDVGGGSNSGGGSVSRPPDWARGAFAGYNDRFSSDIELNITASGGVTQTIRDDRGRTYTYRGNWRDARVTLDNHEFDIRRERNGIRLTEIRDRRNTVYLERRDSGGGNSNDRLPSWMIGTFEGHNNKYNNDVVMTITSAGQVTQQITESNGKESTSRGTIRNQTLELGGKRFTVTSLGRGLRIQDQADRSHRVDFERQGSVGGGNAERPPSWAVGVFEGRNDKYNNDVVMTTTLSGSVTWRITENNGKVSTQRGIYRDGRIEIGGNRHTLERTRDGVSTRKTDERDNRIDFRRVD